MNKMMMDANTATADIAYKVSEFASIYPITPSSPMAENADDWASSNKKNIFGNIVKIMEMQSEAGAAGTLHGSLLGGTLSTTFTASQGLLLMIPNMFKIAGELLPTVLHVSARTIASHALNIYGDHSDVMATRQTGFAMLCSANSQEAHDLALVSHLATLESRVPFLHFFDGFRSSHEITPVEIIDEELIKKIYPYDKLEEVRKRALNPDHPTQTGTAQNTDIFFQNREAANTYYNNCPAIVQKYMDKVAKITGRKYHLFDYYGCPDATEIVISMASSVETLQEVVDYLVSKGKKVALIKVRLYRPFDIKALNKIIPSTCKKIAVLDRTKENGSAGEPLYLDVVSALQGRDITICGGRYGLGGKDFTPCMAKAVFDNLRKRKPLNNFTVGIEDDVTRLSLPVDYSFEIEDKDIVSCKFFGLGSDGTVSANKNTIKIIGDHTDLNAQGYFVYDSKKSGSITISHLRFGKPTIHKPYLITSANIVACHNESFLTKYDILDGIKENGILLLNTYATTVEDLDKILTAEFKQTLAKKHINLYVIDALHLCEKIGLKGRISTVMQSAFFRVLNLIPMPEAIEYMKKSAYKSYAKKGEAVLNANYNAIEQAPEHLIKIDIPESWATTTEGVVVVDKVTDEYYNEIIKPIIKLNGDKLPVSKMTPDGRVPTDTTRFEKRGIAAFIPTWKSEKCIQCNQCSFVCPHAAITPVVVKEDALANAPETYNTLDAMAKKGYKYRLQINTMDCTGCGSCANICPRNALEMVESNGIIENEVPNYEYTLTLDNDTTLYPINTVKGSQFLKPYFEFSGACAGCGETPYIKLATQLFGDRMLIANATGCSSIYGGSSPTCPYSKDKKGHGPAWGNSLFEDNAEFGYGLKLALMTRIDNLKTFVENHKDCYEENDYNMLIECLTTKDIERQKEIKAHFENLENDNPCYQEIKKNLDLLVTKSVWIFGGDGWAYDIGYGGLDHVLASGQNVNVLVLDTEVYSNTGGQSSKSTQLGAVAKFAAGGKRTTKKPLGEIAMQYGDVYVAQVSMGANKQQVLNAMIEAESYDGPSLIIAYATCINHGINMTKGQDQQKKAVECGYFNLFRYDPRRVEEGKNPFILDSKNIDTTKYREFITSETRYSSLIKKNPTTAEKLFTDAEESATRKIESLKNKAE